MRETGSLRSPCRHRFLPTFFFYTAKPPLLVLISFKYKKSHNPRGLELLSLLPLLPHFTWLSVLYPCSPLGIISWGLSQYLILGCSTVTKWYDNPVPKRYWFLVKRMMARMSIIYCTFSVMRAYFPYIPFLFIQEGCKLLQKWVWGMN